MSYHVTTSTIDLPEQVDLKLDVKFLHVTAPLCFKMQTIVAYRYRYGQNLTKIFQLNSFNETIYRT